MDLSQSPSIYWIDILPQKVKVQFSRCLVAGEHVRQSVGPPQTWPCGPKLSGSLGRKCDFLEVYKSIFGIRFLSTNFSHWMWLQTCPSYTRFLAGLGWYSGTRSPSTFQPTPRSPAVDNSRFERAGRMDCESTTFAENNLEIAAVL